ncbi:hypothetical protein CANINC_004191 [Pichia inconspicua]|uniref:GPI inositol-deacylase n=1 Tax=Pichia inconspicua TaxID=52247 RepID=A0A4T0WWP4_9ASCO|nr:hypothetical protein CANINC_004191 [[Candida] inconspicua]
MASHDEPPPTNGIANISLTEEHKVVIPKNKEISETNDKKDTVNGLNDSRKDNDDNDENYDDDDSGSESASLSSVSHSSDNDEESQFTNDNDNDTDLETSSHPLNEKVDTELLDSDDYASSLFGFQLPFSGATDFIDDIKVFKNKNFLHKHFHKEEPPKLLRKFNQFTKVLKSNNKVVLPKPIPLKRPYNAKSPYPPKGTRVYWDDISNVSIGRELEIREDAKLRLERQESLDTQIEAVVYKDISHLDDGKLKALGKSLLPEKPIKTLNTTISAIKLKRDATPSGIGLRSISETTIESKNEFVPPAKPLNESNGLTGAVSSSDQMISAADAAIVDKMPTMESNSSFSDLKLSASKMLTSASNYSTNLFSRELDVFDKLEGDVIVLGGYRGSTLRSVKSKRRLWIPNISDGVGIIKKNSLKLGPNDEDELRELNAKEYVLNRKHKSKNPINKANRPKVYPDGMLTHIGPVDISRKLLKRLNSNPKVVARDWGYDWRLSIHHLSLQLHEYIKSIVEQQKEKKGVYIIAHSMGGIVSHGAMVLDPSLVRGIVYAGTPMPCSNILGPLRFTDAILFNKDLLSLESNFFMRSSFIFLPPSWNGDNGMCLFRDLKDGRKYNIDFFNPVNWIIYNLNPLVSLIRLQNDFKNGVIKLSKLEPDVRQELESVLYMKVDPETYEIVSEEINRLSKPVTSFVDSYMYLRRTLQRTKTFLQTLERKEDVKYPPMAQIYSNGVPSVKYSLVNGEESIKRGEYYRFFYGPGDGVLYQGWAFPRVRGRHDPTKPVKYGYDEKYAFDLCGRFHGSCAHIALLADIKLVGKALEALLEEEERRKCKSFSSISETNP